MVEEERRQHSREDVSLRVDIILDKGMVSGTVKNMSRDGALIRLDREFTDSITESDMDRRITFHLHSENEKVKKWDSSIVRVMRNEGITVIAMMIF